MRYEDLYSRNKTRNRNETGALEVSVQKSYCCYRFAKIKVSEYARVHDMHGKRFLDILIQSYHVSENPYETNIWRPYGEIRVWRWLGKVFVDSTKKPLPMFYLYY